MKAKTFVVLWSLGVGLLLMPAFSASRLSDSYRRQLHQYVRSTYGG